MWSFIKDQRTGKNVACIDSNGNVVKDTEQKTKIGVLSGTTIKDLDGVPVAKLDGGFITGLHDQEMPGRFRELLGLE